MADFGYPAQYSLIAHTQAGGTCYAHACASVIRAAECRIVGRVPQAHQELVDQIIARHGTSGGICRVVLQEECAKRQLRCQDLGETQAHDDCMVQLQGVSASLRQRTLVMSFRLDDHQWSKFSGFFRRRPTGILRAKDIGECRAGTAGHSVVVTGEGEKAIYGQVRRYWKCKNSWGCKLGDSGRFRIDKLAFPMRWLDVVFDANELTPLDFQQFVGAPVRASVVVTYSLDYMARQLPGALPSGLETGQRFDVSFASLNAGQMHPSRAHPHGRGSFKNMYILRDGDGQFFALKTLRDNSGDLKEEVVKHLVAAVYASTFDKPQRRIKFCVPVIVELEAAHCMNGERAASYRGLLEPFLSGSYSKFVFKQTLVPHDLPQAFFHHSYKASGMSLLVWDLQGVAKDGYYSLTDPVIVFGEPGQPSQCPAMLGSLFRLRGAHSVFADQHDTFRALHTCKSMCAQLLVAPKVNDAHSAGRCRRCRRLRRRCWFCRRRRPSSRPRPRPQPSSSSSSWSSSASSSSSLPSSLPSSSSWSSSSLSSSSL
ncbi:unnamed protein product [Polarella glacialis]|uniref:Alpha-type protein kinase domain-containing protein n=1 Tax=Polarella glacialis TaxID=89957 RepID=A0A813KZC9_POLGL|nr:unnamed protein product [Polarella glacialis]CAE8715642.1 unnamed protein product [Polarella glacialis]